MPRVITNLCQREGSCRIVCPVECIVPGKPVDDWPTYVIDPDTCIDCGACEPECPFSAIYPSDEVPSAYHARGGEILCAKAGTSGFEDTFTDVDHDGEEILMPATRVLAEDEVVDLTPSIAVNRAFFAEGPGYAAS